MMITTGYTRAVVELGKGITLAFLLDELRGERVRCCRVEIDRERAELTLGFVAN